MFKGLFNEKIGLIIRSVKCKSYSKTHGQCVKLLAVCFAIVTLASCGEKTGNSMFQSVKNAADALVHLLFVSIHGVGTHSKR